jgi:threonine synthase
MISGTWGCLQKILGIISLSNPADATHDRCLGKSQSHRLPGRLEPQDFPIFNSPQTRIPTLANGNPQTYPILAPLVHKTNGEFITFDENLHVEVSRLVAYETGIKAGPAAAIAVGGFFQSLQQGLLQNGERVMINLGEGTDRAPDLLEEMTIPLSKLIT